MVTEETKSYSTVANIKKIKVQNLIVIPQNTNKKYFGKESRSTKYETIRSTITENKPIHSSIIN